MTFLDWWDEKGKFLYEHKFSFETIQWAWCAGHEAVFSKSGAPAEQTGNTAMDEITLLLKDIKFWKSTNVSDSDIVKYVKQRLESVA